MDAEFDAVLEVPFGALGLRTRAETLSEIRFLPPGTTPVRAKGALERTACARLRAWLDDPDARIELPLAAAGTPFQRRVWKAIAAIPRGETRTYGSIALALAASARAVGQACAANPFPIVVPCHRVVAAGGGPGGFAGARGGFLIEVKRWLLRHEGAL